MHISFDTDNLSNLDRQVLALLANAPKVLDHVKLAGQEYLDSTPDTKEETPTEDKPKRTRRTKAQIAADEAAAAAEKAEDERPAGDGTAKLNESEPEDEPTEDDGAATIERLTELASKLVVADRSKLVEILKANGVRRASEVPAGDLGKVIAEVEAALV